MKRFRIIATAIAAACLMGSAVAAAPLAAAGTTPPAAAASVARPPAAASSVRPDTYPCQNTAVYAGSFNRCTSSSPNGSWVPGACQAGQNYNATNGPFNVYAAFNDCPYRVWLHQYVNWQNNGWSTCTSPDGTAFYDYSGTVDEHPMNIYVSTTQSQCPGQNVRARQRQP